MLKEQKNNIFVLAIVAILGILLATATPAAALDIKGIYMTSCMDHLNGAAYTDPWGLEVWINIAAPGTLHHIDMTLPGDGTTYELYNDNGSWYYESWPTSYSDLGDLRTVYPTGDYRFDFWDVEDNLLDSVTLDYPALSEPGDFVHITSPLHGATDVSIDPMFTWAALESSDGDALGMWLWDAFTDDDVYENVPVPMTETSWGPLGPLEPDYTYWLEVSVFRVDNPQDGPALPIGTTVEGDDFTCGLLIEYLNEIEFTTVPEPATVALLGLGCLVLIRRRHK